MTDPLFPSSPNHINPLPALQFGETAIDLTAAGVFPAGTCEAFGSTFIKSRASASFGAELKDFIAPVPVNISNCGRVTIIKHTDPRGINQDFSYTSNLSGTTLSCTQTSAASFTLNDNGNTTGDSAANTQDCTNVPAGSYTVTEGAEPNGYTLESLTCVTDPLVGGGSGSQHSRFTTGRHYGRAARPRDLHLRQPGSRCPRDHQKGRQGPCRERSCLLDHRPRRVLA